MRAATLSLQYKTEQGRVARHNRTNGQFAAIRDLPAYFSLKAMFEARLIGESR